MSKKQSKLRIKQLTMQHCDSTCLLKIFCHHLYTNNRPPKSAFILLKLSHLVPKELKNKSILILIYIRCGQFW